MPPFINKPSHSSWGDWGPDDQLGRLNLLTQEKVLQGIAEVKTGRTFCLSLPLNYPGGTVVSPVRFPPRLQPVIRQGGPYYNYEWRKAHPGITDIACDDSVTLYNQYSTQWDSLAHRGALFDADGDGVAEPLYYNGFRAGEHLVVNPDCSVAARALGIENMAAQGVQGRGVLVDLFSEFGETRKEVGYDDLMRVMQKDGVVVEKGDILCLWTGLDQMILRMGGSPDPSIKTSCAVLDGRDEKLLQWIEESGIAAIGSDTIAVEAVPPPPNQTTTQSKDDELRIEDSGTNQEPSPSHLSTFSPSHSPSLLPLHDRCLFRLGIHLGELWHLAELAGWLREHSRSRFLLTAPPLRLPGAVGSPVTPIATV